MKANTEYKDNISIDDVKTGEIIRTEIGNHYLVIKTSRSVNFVEIDLTKRLYRLGTKITHVFRPNGSARIIPIEKEEE